jgi:exosortase
MNTTTASASAAVAARRLAASLIGGAAVVGLLSLLYWRVLPDMAVDWWTDEGNSHGLLIVPLVLYIVWRQWGSILTVPAAVDLRGLCLTLAACGVYAVGRMGAEFFLTRISFVVLLAGLTWTFWGYGRLRRLAFPILLLATMVPLPTIVFNQLAAPLQLLASRVATETAQLLGVAVYREGNIIHLAETTLGVAEACSGLRSISSLVIGALLLGYLDLDRVWARVVLFALAIPAAILTNVIRVAGTALLSDRNPELGTGFYHTFSGWLVFLVGLGILLASDKLLKRLSGAKPLRDKTI